MEKQTRHFVTFFCFSFLTVSQVWCFFFVSVAISNVPHAFIYVQRKVQKNNNKINKAVCINCNKKKNIFVGQFILFSKSCIIGTAAAKVPMDLSVQ